MTLAHSEAADLSSAKRMDRDTAVWRFVGRTEAAMQEIIDTAERSDLTPKQRLQRIAESARRTLNSDEAVVIGVKERD